MSEGRLKYMMQTLREARSAYADFFIGQLPEFKGLTQVRKNVLGTGGEYDKTVVDTIGHLAETCKDRHEFESSAGLYANAPRTHAREVLLAHYRENVTASMTDWKRELRWLFHACKKILAGKG